MKTVKILIATAILSTSFYACKKEEMNLTSGEVNLTSQNQNNLSANETNDLTNGMVKIVFNKVGTMVIEGNANLEKLISMYNASGTAISAAKEVFDVSQQETLSIVFNNDGYAIVSDIPKVTVGSTMDAFINNFCKIKPSTPMTLAITKNNLTRNYEEFWNALPAGANQNFLNKVKNLQEELPLNYSLQVSFTENQAPSVIYLDGNGNPQPIQNSQSDCDTIGFGWITSFLCSIASVDWV